MSLKRTMTGAVAVCAATATLLGAAAVAAVAAPPTDADTDPPRSVAYPANWPDLEPYGIADQREEISARDDNSMVLDLELRPQDEELGRVWMRDTYVNRYEVDGESLYVATGTTRVPGLDKAGPWNDGFYVWTAPGLDGPWTLVDTTGIRPDAPKGKVWSPEFVDENTAERTVVADWQTYKNPEDSTLREGQAWAPELHYIDGTWYLAGTMGDNARLVGSFVLVSDGGPEGPYRNIEASVDKPLGDLVRPTNQTRYHIDGGLFDDGEDTYLVLHNHEYALFTDDMENLVTPTNLPKFDQTTYKPEPYLEGATVTKYGGKYYLMHAAWSRRSGPDSDPALSYLPGGTQEQYDAIVAVADSFEGPYTERYTAGVGAGHNNMFIDESGQVWMTFFRNPNFGYWADPVRLADSAVPGVIKLEWTGPDGNRLYAQRPVDAPTYDSTASYQRGDIVAFGGASYEAQWWTRGQEPGVSPFGPWVEAGFNGACGASWTASGVYGEGDAVVRDGALWKAQWWTRNQEPGTSPWGPWSKVASC
ncbi:family 43 glycosylhydrolase [Demequina sp. NBRC 110051]|uniref:family 43 glycosylhydrolase n=1 Tax=Demequina sp. NBRC 110051 TaxID=1570340 RepID=UPI000A0133E7|nr:family 43 glycosylhydrolase [Demequina sp. NBRC 110051]